MEMRLSQQDGLIAFDPGSTDFLLEQNPMEFHSEFHRICQRLFPEVRLELPQPGSLATALTSNGHGVERSFLSRETARAVSAAFDCLVNESSASVNAKINADIGLQEQIVSVISEALLSGIGDELEAYLGCFFRIDHCDLMRSRLAPDSGASFLWHRDFDPMAKLHVLIYLTDCEAESPATLFTNFQDTRRCAQVGYSFPARSKRIADLAMLFPSGDTPISLVRPTLSAGDATVFAPSRILHRGDVRGHGVRDLIVLNIVPSLNPWDRELAAFPVARLFANRSTLWYDPFSRDKLSIAGHDEVSAPIWAELAYQFPLRQVES